MSSRISGALPKAFTYLIQDVSLKKENRISLFFQEIQFRHVFSNKRINRYLTYKTSETSSILAKKPKGSANLPFVSSGVLSQRYMINLFTGKKRSRSYSFICLQKRWHSSQTGASSAGNTSSRDTCNKIENSPHSTQTDQRSWPDNRKSFTYVGGNWAFVLSVLAFSGALYCQYNDGELCNIAKEKLGVKKK